jgi:phage baseplate assembly protein gpV
MEHCLTFGLENEGLFYGRYKARVIDNNDPNGLGRLKVWCEQVHGDTYPDTWAWPITPYAGASFGFWAIPDKDELVWVAFDHGRPEYPLWEGGWWATGETTPDMVPTNVVLVVKEGLKVVLNRQDKSITIFKDAQNSVVIDDNGITIITSKDVKVTAQGDVDVTAEGDVNVQANNAVVQAQAAKIQAPDIALIGEVSVTGDLNVSGNTITAGTNSAHHIHPLNTLLNIAEPGA